MWKLQRLKDGDRLVLSISGRIEGDELFELQREVCSQEPGTRAVELELQSLRLVDQQAVTFLTCCEVSGILLRNCPSYIREWIEREKTKQGQHVQP
jgi:ABC-type transporter Mla MlaB component